MTSHDGNIGGNSFRELPPIIKNVNLGIVGGRNFTNYNPFKECIRTSLEKWKIDINSIQFVVSGGARGADLLAEKWAREHNLQMKIFKPDWNKFGKKAGILRNSDIVDFSTHMIAFPTKQSVGTWDSIRKAFTKQIPIEVCRG